MLKSNLMHEVIQELIGTFHEVTAEAYEEVISPRLKFSGYKVKSTSWNEGLVLDVSDEEDVNNLRELLNARAIPFSRIVGVTAVNITEVLLRPVNKYTIAQTTGDASHERRVSLFTVNLNYYGDALRLEIEVGNTESIAYRFLRVLPHRFMRARTKRPYSLSITNLTNPAKQFKENEVIDLARSVLFDIEYTYGTSFEILTIDPAIALFPKTRRFRSLPEEPIELVYKRYIPELIEYFHAGLSVDFLPFKFLCYYHVIEYFSDKSAFWTVANELRRLLRKPDFHARSNKYVAEALQVFQKEATRIANDKEKIRRVLQQYIKAQQLMDSLLELNVLDCFEKEVTFDCSKSLTLPAIQFGNEQKFYETLTKRIYPLRCSIVHSNPDFDLQKAVPFKRTRENLARLAIEVVLLNEIARQIIAEADETE